MTNIPLFVQIGYIRSPGESTIDFVLDIAAERGQMAAGMSNTNTVPSATSPMGLGLTKRGSTLSPEDLADLNRSLANIKAGKRRESILDPVFPNKREGEGIPEEDEIDIEDSTKSSLSRAGSITQSSSQSNSLSLSRAPSLTTNGGINISGKERESQRNRESRQSLSLAVASAATTTIAILPEDLTGSARNSLQST